LETSRARYSETAVTSESESGPFGTAATAFSDFVGCRLPWQRGLTHVHPNVYQRHQPADRPAATARIHSGGLQRMGGVGDFNGLSVTVKRQFNSGWLLGANYLWSHSIDDDGVGGGEAVYPENIACRSCDRASSDQDIWHSFTSSAIYQLPFGPGRKYLNQQDACDSRDRVEHALACSIGTNLKHVPHATRRAQCNPAGNAPSTEACSAGRPGSLKSCGTCRLARH
jgi:hypothetical protein